MAPWLRVSMLQNRRTINRSMALWQTIPMARLPMANTMQSHGQDGLAQRMTSHSRRAYNATSDSISTRNALAPGAPGRMQFPVFSARGPAGQCTVRNPWVFVPPLKHPVERSGTVVANGYTVSGFLAYQNDVK